MWSVNVDMKPSCPIRGATHDDGILKCLFHVFLNGQKEGGKDEHHHFEEKGVGECERRAAWHWQRLCGGASDGIEEMMCTDDDVLLGISTMLDDGDSLSDHWSPHNGWKVS